jgi:myosin protein heavy chain
MYFAYYSVGSLLIVPQTYSGLFLVTVNPYCPLPIYTREYVNMYRGRNREDTKPHIFAMADEAFRNLVEEGQNQSILVT